MKKFVTAVAVLALAAMAVPALAATNPFMDVPMNHWAYDAIGQLAAHGILSGYPDGTYKGQQPTTRYEMASALARALAVVDMTKASRQDVEMLQKLVVEFHDELEALGVRVDDIEGKVNLLDERLGGWRLSGQLRLDISNIGSNTAEDGEADGNVKVSRSFLTFEKWFGEDGEMHFFARTDGEKGAVAWRDFYIEVPFFFDTKLTVGRVRDQIDLGADYYIDGTTSLGEVGGFGLDSVLTDRTIDALMLEKQFGLGRVLGYVSHNDRNYTLEKDSSDKAINYGAWELFGMAQMQFTERFGFDIGGQAFIGDNAEPKRADIGTKGDLHFGNLWTLFGGLRFNFTDDIAFRAIYYHQQWNGDYWRNNAWRDMDADSANHWRVILDVNQNALKYTGLWLEYGQIDSNFFDINGGAFGMIDKELGAIGRSNVPTFKYWRIALMQTWNEKWATHEYYFGYDLDTSVNDKPSEWSIGVTYTLNPSVKFGLNYLQQKWDGRRNDNDQVRFRTQVSF